MKKILFAFATLSVLISCKKEQQNMSEINSTNTFRNEALAQRITDLEGHSVTFEEALSRHKGRVVLVDVWASWCPDCIKGMPKLHQLQQEYDLIYMFLSYDRTQEDWRAGIDKYKVIGENYLIESDWKTGEFRKAIDLDWIPRYILVNQNGEIAHYRAIEADDRELITKIKELIQ